MKEKLKLFVLHNCPYCIAVLGWIKKLKAENPKYEKIEIDLIEEKEQAELAATYDYYYVPTFYHGKTKLHEGGATKEKVAAVFEKYLQY